MMVTELAPCPSLMDCIKKRDDPDEAVKAKLMLDAAKGLAYLDVNGVLHRHIKPESVLVLSLDEAIDLNGKLTDFGSSPEHQHADDEHDVHNAIGMPVFKALEVLLIESFQMSTDVFSFEVTMFECVKWSRVPSGSCSPFRGRSLPVFGVKDLDRPLDLVPDHFGLID